MLYAAQCLGTTLAEEWRRMLIERSVLDDIVSTGELRTFKPDPTVYAHAVECFGQDANVTWLVSSNPFDVIGEGCRLRTA